MSMTRFGATFAGLLSSVWLFADQPPRNPLGASGEVPTAAQPQVSDNGEQSPSSGLYGDIRGWDVHTGKLLWSFHTVPRAGEAGVETWEGESWKNRSGTNVWAFFTIDTERGTVYAPVGAPTSDYYGGDRKGSNLYGNSVVALDAA